MAIGSNFARRTPATLADLARQYLNQALPDISGIFQPKVDTPVEETPIEETTPGITPQLLQSRGGDDFSVYNPDMNRVRTDYRPYDYRQAMAKSGVGIPSGILSNSEFLYGPKSDLSGLLNVIPYIGPIKRGVEFVGGILDPYLPVNQRSIMENEARGMGILTDDIGRIVQGSGAYDTGANVMAGYNLSQLTPESIEKRRNTILKAISKPGYSGNLQDRLDALDEFEEMMFGTTGVKAKTNTIVDAKKKEKDPTYRTLDELVTAGLAEGDDDDDENKDFLDFLKATNSGRIPSGITGIKAPPGIGPSRTAKEAIDRSREREREREKQKIKQKDLQQMRGPIGRSDPAPGTGSGGGGSPAQQAATRSRDLRGGPGKNYGPYG